MIINVLLFGVAKALASSKTELRFEISESKITPKILKTYLLSSNAIESNSRQEWNDVIDSSALAVDLEYVEGNWENDQMELNERMEVSVIPTVSGG
jgi:hypothetical protein